MIRSQAIRDSARGEECTVELPGTCIGGTETTVFAHSNHGRHGKGLGLKASDEFGAYACVACHSVIDGQAPAPHLSRADILRAFYEGMSRTRRILCAKGLL